MKAPRITRTPDSFVPVAGALETPTRLKHSEPEPVIGLVRVGATEKKRPAEAGRWRPEA